MTTCSTITGSLAVDLMIGHGEPCDYLKIPNIWLERLLSPNGTCNMIACAVLAQIKFAYRPKKNEDGSWGKYFSGDIFRISYDELAAKVHQTKCSVRNACTFLEEKGLIKRVFRTVMLGGVRQSNVLFIELRSSELLKLEEDVEKFPSCDEDADKSFEVSEKTYDTVNPSCECNDLYLSTKLSTGMNNERDTKDNKRLINNTINIYPSFLDTSKDKDGSGCSDFEKTERVVRENIEYDRLRLAFPDLVFLVDKAVYESTCAIMSKTSFALSGNRIISPEESKRIFERLTFSDFEKVIPLAAQALNGVKSLKFYLRTSLFDEVSRRVMGAKTHFPKAGYGDFMHRDYDFDEIERSLIAN